MLLNNEWFDWILNAARITLLFNNFTFIFLQHENLEGYRQYLYGVVGFFVIEDHVLNTGNGLVTRSYLDEVWEMASGKVSCEEESP